MKKILFLVALFAIMLTGCAKDDPVQPETGKTAYLTSIEGKISGWNKGGNCTVEFYAFDRNTSLRRVFASSKISSNGCFNLSHLKDPSLMVAPVRAVELCTVIMGEILQNTASCSDSSVLIHAYNSFAVKDSSGREVGTLHRGVHVDFETVGQYIPRFSADIYIYAAEDVSFSGFIKYRTYYIGSTEDSPYFTKIYDYSLKKGWNKVTRCYRYIQNGQKIFSIEHIYTKNELPGARWTFTSNQ